MPTGILEILLSRLYFDYSSILDFSADQTLYTVVHDISELSYIDRRSSLLIKWNVA